MSVIICPTLPLPPPPLSPLSPLPQSGFGSAVEAARLRVSAAERWARSSAALLESAQDELDSARDYLSRLQRLELNLRKDVRPTKSWGDASKNTADVGDRGVPPRKTIIDDEEDINIGDIVVTLATGETDNETFTGSMTSSLGMVSRNNTNPRKREEELKVADAYVREDTEFDNERQLTEKSSKRTFISDSSKVSENSNDDDAENEAGSHNERGGTEKMSNRKMLETSSNEKRPQKSNNDVKREVRRTMTAAREAIIQIGNGGYSVGSSKDSYQKEAKNVGADVKSSQASEGSAEKVIDAKRESATVRAARRMLQKTASRAEIKKEGTKGHSIESSAAPSGNGAKSDTDADRGRRGVRSVGSAASSRNKAINDAEHDDSRRASEMTNRKSASRGSKATSSETDKGGHSFGSAASSGKEAGREANEGAVEPRERKEEDQPKHHWSMLRERITEIGKGNYPTGESRDGARRESNLKLVASNNDVISKEVAFDCESTGHRGTIEVTECGIPEINGCYRRFQESDGVPSYSKIDEYEGREAVFTVSRWSSDTGTKKWLVTATVAEGEKGYAFYVAFAPSFVRDPPRKNWMVVEGGEDFLSDEYVGRGIHPTPVIGIESDASGGTDRMQVAGRRSSMMSRRAVRNTVGEAMRRRSFSTPRPDVV